MTTIRVSCPDCGAVDLAPSEIRLTVVHGAERHQRYDFRCPGCRTRVERDADGRVAELLRAGGVAENHRDVGHPEEHPGGPPLDVDDLLDLILQLDRDDWFERLLAAGR